MSNTEFDPSSTWCPDHRGPLMLCEDLHTGDAKAQETAANYTSMIRRDGLGADVDGKADPLVQEPNK